MEIQWLINLLSSEFYRDFIITYTATGVLDALKNKMTNKKELPIDLQVVDCLAKSLEETCNSLEWEYDVNALGDVVLISLMNVEENFTKERLAKCLRLEGSNFRLGGIAPITRAVPSFRVPMRLAVLVAGQKGN